MPFLKNLAVAASLALLLCTFTLADNKRIYLDVEVKDQLVSLNWKSSFPVREYILFWAPYPKANPILDAPLGLTTSLTVKLPYGSAFWVAIAGVDKTAKMYFSNVEYFRVLPIYRPKPGTTWQWQLTGPIEDVNVEMFDVDLFETPKGTIKKLKNEGKKVICYVNVGAYEPYRPDAGKFPPEVLGKPLEGWPDERWLDIRRIDVLAPIIEARLDLAVEKGCDGIEPDNIDAYLHNTGFPITVEDQIRFDLWLVKEAHKRGLSIGLKNSPELAEELEPYFDWALTEECFYYNECKYFLNFIKDGKAVFAVEYHLDPDDFCPEAKRLGFSAVRKNLELDAYREECH